MDWLGILFDPGTTGPLWLSARVLVVTGPLLLAAGILLGYYLTGKKTMARTVVDFLVTLPLVFPPIATGFVLLLLLGRDGPVGRLSGLNIVFSFSGIVIASFVAGLPLVVKPIEAALRENGTKMAEAAYVLGKSPWQTFFLVLLPNIRKNVASGWFLALGRILGEVGITLMLGGNIIGRTNTLSLEIYNAVFSGEFDRAIVLSCVIGAVSLCIFAVLRKLSAV